MLTSEEKTTISDQKILEIDYEYCSFGDTIHYDKIPKIFRNCSGAFMYDSDDVEYLDLQNLNQSH